MSIGTRGSRGFWGLLAACVAALAALAAPAQAEETLLSDSIDATGSIAGTCTDRPRDGAGVWTERIVSPALGGIKATLSGGSGDWDLAIFSAGSGATVAGSAYTGSDEVAGGWVFEDEPLIVQACALPGASGSPQLDVTVEAIERDQATPPPSLLRVSVPDEEAYAALSGTGMDVTESVGPGYVDVIAYGADDREALAKLKLPFSTRIEDLTDEDHTSAASAARAGGSEGLPSGRTGTYRRLFDYNAEMKALAAKHPKLVRVFTLPYKTYEGRKVQGIEITRRVRAVNDGKPVFMQMGLHHAREWPSGEHAMEWAYELIKGLKAGKKRATRVVRKSRTVIIPVVNPDGYNASREAGELQGAASGRGGDETQETVNILSHPNEYRRKNCRYADDSNGGSCVQPAGGAASIGVDPNRNYGGFWGGPGASTDPTAEDYRGPGPFSEPETRNIRSFISRRQVTAFITNHSFTGLVLRPPGISSQGKPVDEKIFKRLGAKMASENGYVNQPAYGLYDTTGSTEDWAYYATGALGYTFEIGESNFHPPYDMTVAEWDGTSPMADGGGGNRAAYYRLANFVTKRASHAVIKGRGPKRGLITISKTFKTPTSPVQDETGEPGKIRRFKDHLSSTVRVKRSGRFKFNINPSTRPLVAQSSGRRADGPPSPPIHFNGSPATTVPCGDFETEDATCWNDHPFKVPKKEGRDNDSAVIDIEWATPASDWDMKVFRDSDGDGSSVGEKKPVGSSATGAPGSSEQTTIAGGDFEEGAKYVVRMVNFAAVEPYDGTVTFQGPSPRIESRKERWTITCRTRKGKVTGTRKLYIERGQRKKLNLRKGC